MLDVLIICESAVCKLSNYFSNDLVRMISSYLRIDYNLCIVFVF
jgi:hypothetical protein